MQDGEGLPGAGGRPGPGGRVGTAAGRQLRCGEVAAWVLLWLHGLVFESWNTLKDGLSELLFLVLFCFK